MPKYKLTTEEKRLIEAEIVNWLDVAAGYERDFAEGVRLYETKDETCGLCPRFKKRTASIVHGRGMLFLSCRRCPIVRATGRTCIGWRDELGFPDNFHMGTEAVSVVMEIVKKLRKIVEENG